MGNENKKKEYQGKTPQEPVLAVEGVRAILCA